MNYRHIYHAGNFADVFKHCILIMLIEALMKKASPILFMDTHAGIGKYNLNTIKSKKPLEYKNGVAKIYQKINYPKIIQTYKNIIASINKDDKTLEFYPGSPFIVRALMRPRDSLILTELHPEDSQTLKHIFNKSKKIAVHQLDGYQALKAFLPPRRTQDHNYGRGLILIDPAFEEKDEYDKIIYGLNIALKKFPLGTYMIWYPIKEQKLVHDFYNKLKEINYKNILISEISIKHTEQNESGGLTKCGIVIINPPWQFELELKPFVSWLQQNIY